jgi:hypothetical protein
VDRYLNLSALAVGLTLTLGLSRRVEFTCARKGIETLSKSGLGFHQ